jgi:predicted Zn-dependent protease
LAAADADDLPARKKLAQLAVARADWAAAARWSLEGLHIQVMDPQLHQWRAEALAAQGNPAAAADEYAAAVELDPEVLTLRLALAKMHILAKQPDQAKTVLEALLKLDPKHQGAQELLETIE